MPPIHDFKTQKVIFFIKFQLNVQTEMLKDLILQEFPKEKLNFFLEYP